MFDHQKCGWSCQCWYVVGLLLWTASAVSLIYAWIASGRGDMLGRGADFWFWTALVMAVLANPLRMISAGRDCGCGCDSCAKCLQNSPPGTHN